MADISRIKLPDEVVYNIKDIEARRLLGIPLDDSDEEDNKESEENSEE